MKKVPILLILFIFGISTQVWADSVKSMNKASDQIKTMKMEENNVNVPKKTGSGKDPLQTTEKRRAGFRSVIPYSYEGAIAVSSEPDANFLMTLEQKKRSRWVDSLDQVISTYEFFQNDWRDKFLNFQKGSDIKSPHQNFDLSTLRPSPNRNTHFEEEGILTTLKLLQSKKEEIFNEIFMGFRFSFNPLSGHMFLEMNVAPSSEKGPGIMVPF
jgi:hypothetical protein